MFHMTGLAVHLLLSYDVLPNREGRGLDQLKLNPCWTQGFAVSLDLSKKIQANTLYRRKMSTDGKTMQVYFTLNLNILLSHQTETQLCNETTAATHFYHSWMISKVFRDQCN